MEEEEDVIFDQAGLLTNRVKRSADVRNAPGRGGRLLKTFCLCAAFFGLGLTYAIPGPTLLDLQAQTHTSTKEISSLFTGRSVGYLAGSVVGGLLFDQLNQHFLLFLSLLLTAAGTGLAPWSPNFLILMGLVAFQGVSMGFLDTGGNVLCLDIWGQKSGPYMQALHFSFGLGAFVAPLIAEPFLSPDVYNGTNETVRSISALGLVSYPADFSSDSESSHQKRDLGNGLWQPFENVDTKVKFRVSREADDQSISDSEGNQTIPEAPKKPTVTGGENLNNDEDVASGKILKVLHNTEGEDSAPSNPAPEPAVMDTGNNTDQNGEAILTTTTSTTTTTTTPMTTTTIAPTTTTTTTAPVQTSVPDNEANVTETSSNNNIDSDKSIGKKISQLTEQVTNVLDNLTKVQFAYLAIAVFLLLVAFMFLCVCCAGKKTLRAIHHQVANDDAILKREDRGFRVQILLLLFMFYFLYVGMEITYGGLIMTFSVKYLGWSKSKGTMLTSVFWGTFSLGRGLAIFFAKCLNPAVMLIIDLVITSLSLVGLVIALESNHIILWFCTATLGLGMASIFPTGITWAERYMHVTGKATAVFVVGSALGEMAIPAVTGLLFELKGPIWLLYIMLGASILSAFLYIIMQNLATNKGERYERLVMLISSRGDDDLEMDSLMSSEVNDISPSSTNSLNGMHSISPTKANGSKKKVTFSLPNDITAKYVINRNKPGEKID